VRVNYLGSALPDRIADKIWPEPNSGCWLWGAAISGTGYGMTSLNRRQISAHRLLYELLRGAIPAGLVVDHLCRNRACVNPDHMELVSTKENVRRGLGLTAINARKTAPDCGHGSFEIAPRTGWRRCPVCRRAGKRESMRRSHARKRDAKAAAVRAAEQVIRTEREQLEREAG
jgi:hypothetical protein